MSTFHCSVRGSISKYTFNLFILLKILQGECPNQRSFYLHGRMPILKLQRIPTHRIDMVMINLFGRLLSNSMHHFKPVGARWEGNVGHMSLSIKGKMVWLCHLEPSPIHLPCYKAPTCCEHSLFPKHLALISLLVYIWTSTVVGLFTTVNFQGLLSFIYHCSPKIRIKSKLFW